MRVKTPFSSVSPVGRSADTLSPPVGWKETAAFLMGLPSYSTLPVTLRRPPEQAGHSAVNANTSQTPHRGENVNRAGNRRIEHLPSLPCDGRPNRSHLTANDLPCPVGYELCIAIRNGLLRMCSITHTTVACR